MGTDPPPTSHPLQKLVSHSEKLTSCFKPIPAWLAAYTMRVIFNLISVNYANADILLICRIEYLSTFLCYYNHMFETCVY